MADYQINIMNIESGLLRVARHLISAEGLIELASVAKEVEDLKKKLNAEGRK